MRIWVTGDTGTADANAAAVRDAYLTFTGAVSNVQLAEFRESRAREFGGAAGGNP